MSRSTQVGRDIAALELLPVSTVHHSQRRSPCTVITCLANSQMSCVPVSWNGA
jgi:hypothetical protein